MMLKKDISRKKYCIDSIKNSWELYIFMLPAIILTILFAYVPIYGVQLAFKEFIPGNTITTAPWVGLTHFKRLLSLPDFPILMKNTVSVAVLSNLIGFLLPIIFALLLDQVGNKYFKKTVQTMTYIPHLFSIVVVISMANILLSPTNGVVNMLITKFGGDPVMFFGDEKYVLPIYIITDIWQNLGYGAIIYIAALAGVDQAQLEAAKIDGASTVKIIWHIKLPAIAGTIITMQILRWGQLFAVGADKMLLLQNSLNLGASEILSTYVYKVGLLDGQLGFSTAVNLFNTTINIICLLIVNTVAKKVSDTSLF